MKKRLTEINIRKTVKEWGDWRNEIRYYVTLKKYERDLKNISRFWIYIISIKKHTFSVNVYIISLKSCIVTYNTICWNLFYLLCRLDSRRCRHDHENAVEQDRTYDEQREQWMDKDIDCYSPDRIEWIQNPHRICRIKSKYILSFTYYNKCLKINKPLFFL